MSREIDVSDPEQLSEDDIRYLAARGRLPAEAQYEIEDDPELQAQFDQSQGPLVRDTPHTGAANTDGWTIEQLERQLAKMRLEQDPKEARKAFTSEVPGEDDDDDDEDEDGEDVTEDYDEGWTNDSRRAELSERGLSVEGNKDELIARLLASDAESAEE